MWLIKMLLTGIIIAVILLFAILNIQQDPVKIRFWFTPAYEYRVQFIVALFAAFVLGAFVSFLVSVAHELKSKARISRLEKDKRKLTEELTALRNLPLEDVPSFSPEGGRDGSNE